jgi:hypothetical protein
MCLRETLTYLRPLRPRDTPRAGLDVPLDHGVDPGSTAVGDINPWDRSGAVRRDCQADRGQLLLSLADTALLLGALSLCLGFPSLMALILGVAAWVVSCHDQRMMRNRLMDSDGWITTGTARSRALAGAFLGLYGATLWVCFLAVIR